MSGLFGVVSKEDCFEDLFYGTDYHSHLGTKRAGLAVFGKNGFDRVIHDITKGSFKSRFADEKLTGKFGIGVISDREPQPLIIGSHFGDFGLVMTGLVGNAKELFQQLISDGHSFAEMGDGTVNSVELLAKIITSSQNIADGIQKVWTDIKGSATFLILTKEGIYAARDKLGRLPLVLSQKPGCFAVASESCSFPNLGFKKIRHLGPGEIVLLNPDGIHQICSPRTKMQICAFLWIYTGHPPSDYEDIGVCSVRERCGIWLAKRDIVEADLVAGVPDSGTGHAIGYAIESGLPFRRPLIKYTPSWDRSYTPLEQETRDLVAAMKLIPVREIIKGRRIVLCEDSIVRGTQLAKLIQRILEEFEAAEVHLRLACPPLMFPCPFALSTRGIEELAARQAIQDIEGQDIADISPYLNEGSEKYQKMVEWIRDQLGATTLRYQRLEDMVSAIGLPREKLCLYCWTGQSIE